MTDLQTADIVIVIVILLSALIGLVRGFVKEAVSLAVWLLAFVVALLFAAPLSEQFTAPLAENLSPTWRSMVQYGAAFGALFIGVLVAGAVIQWLLRKLIETTGLSGTDRLLGFLFGGVRGALVLIVVLMAIEPFQLETAWWQESLLRPQLMAFEDDVSQFFAYVSSALREVGI